MGIPRSDIMRYQTYPKPGESPCCRTTESACRFAPIARRVKNARNTKFIVCQSITLDMEWTGMTGEIAVVLLWVAIVAIVLVLLGGAAAAMVWDPNSRRAARATDDGAGLPLTGLSAAHESWPRRH